MKHPTKTERLLDEILAESASAGFDRSMLQQMVRVARQRQRVRRFRQGLLVVAVLGALSLWWWHPRINKPVQAVKMVTPAPVLERSVALVLTQPLTPDMVVPAATSMVRFVATSRSAIALVSTRPADELFQQLDDNQLLALLKDKPVALVRYGPHEASLVMPEALLQEGFRVQ